MSNTESFRVLCITQQRDYPRFGVFFVLDGFPRYAQVNADDEHDAEMRLFHHIRDTYQKCFPYNYVLKAKDWLELRERWGKRIPETAVREVEALLALGEL